MDTGGVERAIQVADGSADASLFVVSGNNDRQQSRDAVGFPFCKGPDFERHQRALGEASRSVISA